MSTVRLWLKDEKVPGSSKMLSETINTQHENVMYLPGVKLPENLLAVPDLSQAAHEATLVIFVVPQQYIFRGLFTKILSAPCAPAVRFLSLVKGLSFSTEMVETKDWSLQSDGTMTSLVPTLVSQQIARETRGASVSVLMGANVAMEVASDQFCEATIGARDTETGEVWFHLLNRPTLRINVVLDVEGVETCGGLKDLVALGAGFCDGLKLGSNTKASIVRMGLEEVRRFAKHVFAAQDGTFFESCGMGDVLTSSYAPQGRHRLCAEAFVAAKGSKSWAALEKEYLNGQTLGDLEALKAVIKYLRFKGVAQTKYPLFSAVHGIAFEGRPAVELLKMRDRTSWRNKSKYPAFAPVGMVLGLVVGAAAALVALTSTEAGQGMVVQAVHSANTTMHALDLPGKAHEWSTKLSELVAPPSPPLTKAQLKAAKRAAKKAKK